MYKFVYDRTLCRFDILIFHNYQFGEFFFFNLSIW